MEKEYRLRKNWMGLGIFYLILPIYLFWPLIGVPPLSKSEYTELRVTIAITLLLVLLIFLLLWSLGLYKIFFERIIVSKNGVEYYSFGFSIKASWNAVMSTGFHQMKLYKFDGLFVDKIQSDIKNPFGFLDKREPFIPLTMFDKNWRTSELGQQIKDYAPHLFD
jgi:hypothetical protein